MSQTSFSDTQKRQFLRDGFIVIKNAVPRDVCRAARDRIESNMPPSDKRQFAPPGIATHEDVLRLFNGSCLTNLLQNEMGPFPDVISCQIAFTPGHDTLGGSPGPHVDGSWGGVIPSDPAEIDLSTGRPKDAPAYFGENDSRKGTNDGWLWLDPDHTISLGSYTALVGVALNDQLIPGNGQLGVIKGVHEEVEAAFRRQRDSGGVIGPEGLGWPRIKISEDGKPYLNGLFESVRQRAGELGKNAAALDNWPWPELTPVLLAEGDAVIAMHACPHTPTQNYGPVTRMNIYFRIRRLRENNPHEGSRRLGHGVSDHLDRGFYGQHLDYPPEYDPWKTSVDKLCDHWSEWDGMQGLRENA